METLPKDIFRMQNLSKLSIRQSVIKEIPSEIVTLTKLVYLDFHDSSIKEVPQEIGLLKQLEVLDISWNILYELPDEISNLKLLKRLDASYTRIKNIPIIQSLQWINLEKNDISEFPKGVLCPSMEGIDLSCNSITYIESSALDKLEKYGPNFILDLRANWNIELESHGDQCGLVEIVRRLGSRVLYDVRPKGYIEKTIFYGYDDKKTRNRSFETKALLFKYQNALKWEKKEGKHIAIQISGDDIYEGTMQYFTKYKSFKELSHAIDFKYEDKVCAGDGRLFLYWLDNAVKSFMSEGKELFKMVSADEKLSILPVKKTDKGSDEEPYVVLGRIISLAILRNCPLSLCLHWSVYMYLTDTQPTLEAVKHFDDELYKQLQKSLLPTDQNSEVNVVNANENNYERVETEAVDKNASETNENNNVDVDLSVYNSYKGYVDDIIPQLKSIKRGMNEMLKYKILHLFHPHELELLICGQAKVDVDKWKKNAYYEDVEADDDVIQWFWEIIASWDDKKVSALYQFITGSLRVPFSGVERLTIVKQHNVEENKVPCVDTCFNKLYLSDYSSKEKFAEILEETLKCSNKGFGMALHGNLQEYNDYAVEPSQLQ